VSGAVLVGPAGAAGPGSGPVVLAHGIGSRQDLPIPFSYALVGAGVAVLVSFLALGLLWRTPRFRGAEAGRPLPARVQAVLDGPAFRLLLRLLGLLISGFVVVAAVGGPDDALNPTPGFVYVLFWVGLVPASLLFGPVWRLLNPLRTVHLGLARLLRTRPEEGLWPLPERLGYWPAAVGLFAFTWLELVEPDRAITAVIKTWFGVYIGLHLLAAAAYGSRWFDRGDAFEAYSDLLGRLSPLGRRADGRLVLRNPFDGLDALRPAPGLVGVVCVLLGSTAYDGFSGSPFWVNLLQTSPLSEAMLGTLGLLGMVLLVAVTYTAATWAAGFFGTESHRALPRQFAHSIIPIAVGYLVAHYFTLLVLEGQRTLILASDPLGTGADLFGTAERGVDARLAEQPTAVATTQVLAIVAGHVLGVIAAHDRAVRLFPRRQALAGQLPLLLLMVGYTVGGLVLLFAA
jgi:hypothetical protein